MEILIIGGIVVALMVLVSTKIKKSAALAYERETVETNDFRLVKPAGFIYPLREESNYAFEAYSKEFGEKSERNIWKAQVYLTVAEGLKFDEKCREIEQEDGKILSKNLIKDAANNERICLLEREVSKDDGTFSEFRRIVESRRQQKTYDLKILILNSLRSEFTDRVDELMNSFELK